MLSNLDVIERLRDTEFISEDGESYTLEFEEGLSTIELEQLKGKFPKNTLAPELEEILLQTKGWDGYGPEMVYFDSFGAFGLEELSPYSISLGHDGFGNFWILDITDQGKLGKVFYACHDPAVLVVHSQNLNEYLNHLLEFYERPDNCHLDRIHDKVSMDIWRNEVVGVPIETFEASNSKIQDFLNQFEGQEWTIVDLGTAENETGFAWGKFGSNNLVGRYRTEHIWVMKNKKRGFLSRLFRK